MSNESDGAGRTDNIDNIDTIRELLRKLEEVAAASADAAQTTAVVERASDEHPAEVLHPLATLRRESAITRPVATPMPEFTARPIELEAIATPLPVAVPPPRPGRGVAVAGASFALGVAAAAGIIVAFDPFKRTAAPVPVAEARKAPSGPADPAPPKLTASPSAAAASIAVATPEAIPATAALAPAPRPVEQAALAPVEPGPHSSPSADGGQVAGADAVPSLDEALAITAAATAAMRAAVPEPVIEMPRPRPELAAIAVPLPLPVPVPVPVSAPTQEAVPAAPGGPKLVAQQRLELRAGERRQLGVRLATEPDAGSSALVVFRNVPDWLALSKGSTIGNGIWLMPAHDSGDVAAEAMESAQGSAVIKVQLASIDGRILAETETLVLVARPSQPSALIAAVPEAGGQSLLRLQTRGELLLDTGEVEAARTLFRTAAEAGSVTAAIRLAETYDPAEVQRLGMPVASADSMQAVTWYERAEALGSPIAKSRLAALGRR